MRRNEDGTIIFGGYLIRNSHISYIIYSASIRRYCFLYNKHKINLFQMFSGDFWAILGICTSAKKSHPSILEYILFLLDAFTSIL